VKRALIGAGGLATEIASQMGGEVTFFVNDEFIDRPTGKALPLSRFDPRSYEVCVAISNPKVRSSIVHRLPNSTKFFTFIHPTAIILNNGGIGEGSFIGCHSIVMNGAILGMHAILNRGNHVGHDARIGDFFTALPSAIVSGNDQIGDRVMLGANSVVLEKLHICSDAVVGACACVTKHIQRPGAYIGIPAKKLELNKGDF
jgi:sugar O-acyltransferase (sialic acid O-acetyltransferase NeuD family)